MTGQPSKHIIAVKEWCVEGEDLTNLNEHALMFCGGMMKIYHYQPRRDPSAATCARFELPAHTVGVLLGVGTMPLGVMASLMKPK